jgi:hypothetical protein
VSDTNRPQHLQTMHGLMDRYAGQSMAADSPTATQLGPLILRTADPPSTTTYACKACHRAFTWSQMVSHLLASHRLSRKGVIDQLTAPPPPTLKMELVDTADLELSGKAAGYLRRPKKLNLFQ